MQVFIKGMGNISPQQSWNDEGLLTQAFDYRGNRMRCIEPVYEEWIDPRQLRRMSRIIRMGVAAALMALKEAQVKTPDAIITGTGYGCLEDTGTFLTKLVELKEVSLNPTPFIQSTHNTIGSQIALLLQCFGYNQTYSQQWFSFENALQDAIMLVQETPGMQVLAGGVDEITDISHIIQSRFGIYRQRVTSTLNIFRDKDRGTINGEGAAYFVLTGLHDTSCIAQIRGVQTFFKPRQTEMENGISDFVQRCVSPKQPVDLVLVGKSGDAATDADLDKMVKQLFPASGLACFKHLCGEYPVASAFAVWMAARILAERHIPEVAVYKEVSRPVRNVLVLNASFGTYYSLILLTSCRDSI
jgi:3-oxoacyl-[acyl-carrier-protein] synthase II